jgi:hemin uptake protein HemP
VNEACARPRCPKQESGTRAFSTPRVIPTQSTMSGKKRKTDTGAVDGAKKKDELVKWITCSARQVILDDIRRGALLDGVSAEAAFKFYKRMPEFEGVGFDQFKARLADHRKQVTKQWLLNAEEEKAFKHDMKLYRNSRTRNKQGKLIFDASPAKLLLREDVKDKKHEGVSPSQFQATRPEYKLFDGKTFRHRVYQEIRRQKFIFHCDLHRRTKGRAIPGGYKLVI